MSEGQLNVLAILQYSIASGANITNANLRYIMKHAKELRQQVGERLLKDINNWRNLVCVLDYGDDVFQEKARKQVETCSNSLKKDSINLWCAAINHSHRETHKKLWESFLEKELGEKELLVALKTIVFVDKRSKLAEILIKQNISVDSFMDILHMNISTGINDKVYSLLCNKDLSVSKLARLLQPYKPYLISRDIKNEVGKKILGMKPEFEDILSTVMKNCTNSTSIEAMEALVMTNNVSKDNLLYILEYFKGPQVRRAWKMFLKCEIGKHDLSFTPCMKSVGLNLALLKFRVKYFSWTT